MPPAQCVYREISKKRYRLLCEYDKQFLVEQPIEIF